ncbi:MAG: hydroxylamine dehydrogenase, partial [Thermodesulfobacteriota bacterium]|nr:hydroxylamine dehydrogenase [Thermodesulfobacteriota bacterium]
MEFLTLSGWPNQGVGRLNPDGSKGLCHSCHSKHEFSISVARKPYTCSQCHKGPDVPAYQAYSVSKHGNLYFSNVNTWKMDSVPWSVGKDFAAPTCATCHVSLLTSADGEVISMRTHQMNDRLPWRIFGLIYAHKHPKAPDTSIITNKDGLPLPTTLQGDSATEFLITQEEADKRRSAMQTVCRSCHSENWVLGHWSRFEQSLTTTNDMTRSATQILQSAWNEKLADPTNPFDEGIERLWMDQWLFYANSTRFASAMQGADYGVFANGRYYLSKNLRDLQDRFLLLKTSLPPGGNTQK